ncbi:MAG TPA: hypothetical protein VEA40_14725 [Ramlibacter sp.]|nr:hypothetical protein [Ramlibacter sp.]
MLQREPYANAAPAGGWMPPHVDTAAADAEDGVMAWLGGGLSIALWGCATVLALYFT